MTQPMYDMILLAEDQRVQLIGETARNAVVGVLLEVDDVVGQEGKITRYIQKVTDRFPDVRHIDTVVQIPHVIARVRFGPKSNA